MTTEANRDRRLIWVTVYRRPEDINDEQNGKWERVDLVESFHVCPRYLWTHENGSRWFDFNWRYYYLDQSEQDERLAKFLAKWVNYERNKS